MEIIFVYSLVLLFLLGLALFSVLILASHPDREERAVAPVYNAHSASLSENIMTYGLLAALLLFFILITAQTRAQQFTSGSTER